MGGKGCRGGVGDVGGGDHPGGPATVAHHFQDGDAGDRIRGNPGHAVVGLEAAGHGGGAGGGFGHQIIGGMGVHQAGHRHPFQVQPAIRAVIGQAGQRHLVDPHAVGDEQDHVLHRPVG